MAEVVMPQLGETVTEGTITKWFKQIGDDVKVDEPLFEVSTDKVDSEVNAPMSGRLVEIRAQIGDVVLVGAVIAVVGSGDAAPVAPPPPPAPEPTVTEAAAPSVATPAPMPAPSIPPPAPSAANAESANRLLSPVVRRLVTENGIDPATITGTGLGGRITRADVLSVIDQENGQRAAPAAPAPMAPAAAVAPAAAAAPAAPRPTPQAGTRGEAVPMPKIRRITGDLMRASLATSPHAFSVVEVDYFNVDGTRNAAKAEWKASEGFSLTYLPFISRAIIDAIADFPHMNATVGDGELIVHRFVDLGIAVDLDYQGLLVPVVRSADAKRLRALAREINDLATRARTRKLGPDEISGGTFTISNNGSAGSVLTAAIINQPQVAIISTDAIKRRPVVVDLPGGEAIAIHSVGNLAMSWDHRAFDGAYAAGFLVRVKEILETRDWASEL